MTPMPPLAAQLLREHLKREGETLGEFALRVGVPHRTLSNWLAGVNRPRVDAAVRIEDGTGGEVGVRAWSESLTPPPESA